MRYLKLPVVVFSILSLLCSCQNQSASTGTKAATDAQLPAGFLTFYDKFHQDSAFQMAHIQWPLRGETAVQMDSVRREKQLASWEPHTWNLQRAVDFSSGEFKREWETMGDDFIIERIRYRAANYGLERHFMRRDDGEWELIYYTDMQEMGQ